MLGEQRRDVQVKTAQKRMRMMAREAKNLSGTAFSACRGRAANFVWVAGLPIKLIFNLLVHARSLRVTAKMCSVLGLGWLIAGLPRR